MAESKKSEKSIEMRLAEIEDKLAQLHITEEEMKTFQKVANALGMGGGAQAAAGDRPAPSPALPISRGIGPVCRVCIIRWVCICNECTCGPCNLGGGGGGFGGGFGGFGM
jgi:hypothetical protein